MILLQAVVLLGAVLLGAGAICVCVTPPHPSRLLSIHEYGYHVTKA